MGQLSSYIKSLREEFTNHYIGSPAHHSQHQLQQGFQDQETPPIGKNLPEVVNNIVWARQLEAKVHVMYMYVYMYYLYIFNLRQFPYMFS